ncbi:MAG: hypothetical protein ACP5U1_01810 [Desulfomonilaceae bacterium]
MTKNLASKIYITTAIICFNVFLLFFVINMVFSGFNDLKEYLRKRRIPTKSSYSLKADDPALQAVYPGLSQSQRSELIRESRSVEEGYAPFVQFKERPFRGKFVNVDPRGFRSINGKETWPVEKNVFNIFILGGSTAFGYGVADDQTIAGWLGKFLRTSENERLVVYNFGRCSYTSVQEGVLLQRLIFGGNIPDLVIFIDGLNDFAHYNGLPGFTQELTKFMEEGDKPAWRKILLELPATKFFLSARKSETSKEIQHPELVIPSVISRYKTNKQIVRAIAEKFRIRCLFVWQPVPVYKYDQQYNIFKSFDYNGFMPYLRAGYETMAQQYATGQLGNNFLWLADMQKDLKQPLYVDAVHYSSEMNSMIARQISKALIQKGMIPHQSNLRNNS